MKNLRLERQLEHLRAGDEYYKSLFDIDERAAGTFEGWFLGPKAENEELLVQLLLEAVWKHCEHRRGYYPEDPTYITNAVKQSDGYNKATQRLTTMAREMFNHLQASAPLASMRSQGHMLWDQVLPATIGYFGAMLYNQNNVAAEASPYTTQLEIQVGNDLCRMLGFPMPSDSKDMLAMHPHPTPWGHITCDGTVANIEALWAARNAKFYPIALRSALKAVGVLQKAKDLQVTLATGERAKLVDLSDWEALNLDLDQVLALPSKIETDYELDCSCVASAVMPFSMQELGLLEFYRRSLTDTKITAPVAYVPATAHYSWPKAATLLGLGSAGLRSIEVDLDARLHLGKLEHALQASLDNGEPVLTVVAVMGSTEENAVDPLLELLHLRNRFRKKGMNFTVHADAAWGGYFASLLRHSPPETSGLGHATLLAEVPTHEASEYVRKQFEAIARVDSVTIDPHKSGYAPYPAGGLCYRNSAMRDMVSLKSPVVFHSQSEPTVGIYGVEGSKPGAAAAGAFLAHRVITLTRDGYGKILRQCIWTSKRMYCRLLTMPDSRLTVTCLQRLPAEKNDELDSVVDAEREFIRQNFVFRTNDNLKDFFKTNHAAAKLFSELGSDGVILAFAFNFIERDTGKPNSDLHKANCLNQRIFEKCSLTVPPKDLKGLNKVPLILTSSTFEEKNYGKDFIESFCNRMGVNKEPNAVVNFLISTAMDPWPTETSEGDFLEEVEQVLRDVGHQVLDEIEGGHCPCLCK